MSKETYDRDGIVSKLSVYLNNFSAEQLNDYEDEIFTGIDKKKRAEMEFRRLKETFALKGDFSVERFSEFNEIARLIKVSNLSSDILDEVYRRIVKVQLDYGLEVRLYSAFNLIKLEEDMKELRKKASELKHGSKLSR